MARKPSAILSDEDKRDLKKDTTAALKEAKAELKALKVELKEAEKTEATIIRTINAQEKDIAKLQAQLDALKAPAKKKAA